MIDPRISEDDSRIGEVVLNIKTGYLHIFPCPSINPPNKVVSNWVVFETVDQAKEYAKLAELKITPCVCAMVAYYNKNGLATTIGKIRDKYDERWEKKHSVHD